MKWVLSHATDEIHHWQLQQDGGPKFLSFNLTRLSLRLSGITKRLFFLEEQGFLQKKIFLRNEYGIALGETVFSEQPSSGQFILNEKKFFYYTTDTQVQIFDHEKVLFAQSDIALFVHLEPVEFYGLLFAFAWFATADAKEEKEGTLSITA